MKNSKRILSVKIKRMIDEDPDTSHMGEYSNYSASEFSIDRAHSEDCASVVSVNQEGVQKLRNARGYIVDLQIATAHKEEWEDLEDAYNLLDSLADDTPECDCGGHRVSSRELLYFNPSRNYVDKYGKPAYGNTPEEIRKYVRQDYERMESLNAGHWCYIGIRAEAEVSFPSLVNKGCVHGHEVYSHIVQRITSGGLWGIESDSDRKYSADVQEEELAGLKSELLALGFSRRAIATAFKSIDEVSE